MKRRICILILVSLLLCGCSKQQYHVGTFSYTKHCAEYGSAEFGVSIPDPESQEKTPVRNAADAVKVYGDAEVLSVDGSRMTVRLGGASGLVMEHPVA